MTRIFTTGFESGDLREFYIPGGQIATTARPGTGTYSFKVSSDAILRIPDCDDIYIRFWLMNPVGDAGWRAFVLRDELSQDKIALGWGNGPVAMRRNDLTDASYGTTAILPNTWYMIELHYKMSLTDGLIEVRVNGVTEIVYVGQTKTTGNAIRYVVFKKADSPENHYDDLAVNNTSGTEHNSWCGDGRVIALKPNADVATPQWTRTGSGLTANYQAVDEVPSNNETDYISATSANLKDLYQAEDAAVIPSNGTIRHVWAEASARENTSAGDKFQVGFKSGTTETWSQDLDLTPNWKGYKGDYYARNPNTGNNWTLTEVNALQAGVKSK
jgi:hypothetical protein